MSTQIAKQAENSLSAMLVKYRPQIEAVLPKHLTPTRVLKLIVGAINKNPALLSCSPMSVINAVLTAAQMGLEIGPGQSYLVPFGKECTLLIDYRGKIDLAVRSGKVTDIDLDVVYSKEKFRIYRDEAGTKRIEHEPMYYRVGESGEHFPITEKDRGVPIGVYAFAVMKEGPPKIVFMPAIDIDAIRNQSRQKDGAPWKNNTMEMWKKTVAHRICKTLPMSAEKADVMRMSQEADDRFEMGESLDQIVAVEPEDDVPMLTAGEGSAVAAIASATKVAEIGERLAEAAKKAEPSIGDKFAGAGEILAAADRKANAEKRVAASDEAKNREAAQTTTTGAAISANVLQMPTTDKAPWTNRVELYKFLAEIAKMENLGPDGLKETLKECGLEYSTLKFDKEETLKCYRVMEKKVAEKRQASDGQGAAADKQATSDESKPLF